MKKSVKVLVLMIIFSIMITLGIANLSYADEQVVDKDGYVDLNDDGNTTNTTNATNTTGNTAKNTTTTNTTNKTNTATNTSTKNHPQAGSHINGVAVCVGVAAIVVVIFALAKLQKYSF